MTNQIEYVLLADVVEADVNVRDHTDGDPDLVDSIDRFGFIGATLRDDRTGKLLDGHGRLHRLREREKAGRPPPRGIQVTDDGWKIPLITGWSSRDDAEAEAAAIAVQPKDGRYNDRALFEVLHRHDNLIGLGFDTGDIEDLGRRLNNIATDAGTSFRPPDNRFEPDEDDEQPASVPVPPPGTTSAVPKVQTEPSEPPAPTLVTLNVSMTPDQRRTAAGLLANAKERAGLPSIGDALLWALERSPASPSLPEDGARRAADTVRSALKALADGDHDRARSIMASLVGAS